jgi:hypothetical protein
VINGFLSGNNGVQADGYLARQFTPRVFDGFLLGNNGTQADGYLRPQRWAFDIAVSGSSPFPTQYSGLRYFHGTVRELSLVALADAPVGMGGQWRIRKNGTDYAVYLVETTDPNASTVRIRTSTGTKAARLKT